MAKIQVFDPPMCCSTGVCGPDVDPALTRFASDLEWLKESGVDVERVNLAQEPAAFVGNPVVSDAIRGRDDALPLVLLDGKIVATGTYPDRERLAGLVGLTGERRLEGKAPESAAPKACCASTGEAPVKLNAVGAHARKKCC